MARRGLLGATLSLHTESTAELSLSALQPSITVTQILTGIQRLLKEPNELDPAQEKALYDYRDRLPVYEEQVGRGMGAGGHGG